MLVKMMGENTHTFSKTSLLQHLYDKSRSDGKPKETTQSISPIYLHFTALYGFFNGKLSGISINVIDGENTNIPHVVICIVQVGTLAAFSILSSSTASDTVWIFSSLWRTCIVHETDKEKKNKVRSGFSQFFHRIRV